jgi:hypothetical protein
MIPGRARCGMDIVTIAAAGSFVRGVGARCDSRFTEAGAD